MNYPEHSEKTKDIIARRFNDGGGAFVVSAKERERNARIDAIVDARRAEEHEKVKDLREAQQAIYYASEKYIKSKAALDASNAVAHIEIAKLDAANHAKRMANLVANPA